MDLTNGVSGTDMENMEIGPGGVIILKEKSAEQVQSDADAAAALAAASGTKTAEELAAEEAAKTPPAKTAEEIAAEEEANKNKTPEQLAAEEAAKTPPAKTAEEITAEAAAAQTPDQIKAQAQKELLESLGITDLEALKEKLKDPETPEQIAARQLEYNKKLQLWAIDKGVLTPQDFVEVERVKDSPDHDLVYQSFASEFQAENLDRKNSSGEAYPVTPEEIEDAFNEYYHTESDNQSIKAKGVKAIESRANEIRAGVVDKFEQTKLEFNEQEEKRVNVPNFQKFIKTAMDTAIPAEIVLNEGDEDTKVVFSLKDVDRAAIEKELFNNPLFERFHTEGATPELIKEVSEKIQKDYYWANRAKINAELYEKAVGHGMKKGSAVGAEAPFKSHKTTPIVAVKGLDAEDRKRINAMSPYS